MVIMINNILKIILKSQILLKRTWIKNNFEITITNCGFKDISKTFKTTVTNGGFLYLKKKNICGCLREYKILI